MQVFFALTLASVGISHSSTFTTDTTKARGASASVFSIIDRKSKIDPSEESGITLENVKGEIELRHVSFKYPTRPDIQIFRDINLLMRAGKVSLLWCRSFYLFRAISSTSEAVSIGLNFFQTVALVGESGSGKSTVVALLQRFYNPDSGRITLDGTEIQKLQLKWFRQQMGLVGQEPVLFNDTIRANIAYGKGGDATEAEIISAAELANAHKFISSLHQVGFILPGSSIDPSRVKI